MVFGQFRGNEKIKVIGSGLMLAMSLIKYVWWVYLANTYKLMIESILKLFCIKPYNSRACLWTNFFAWAWPV